MKKLNNLLIAFIFLLTIIFTTQSNINLTANAASNVGTPTLSFSDVTASSVTINWEPGNGVYYELYNCTANGALDDEYIYTMGGQSTYSFTHENLSPNTTYYYIIKAYDGRGNSAISPVYSCTTTLAEPALSFSDITNTSITISWNAVTGADYYELYGCCSESGLEYCLIYTTGGGSSFSYTHSDLTKGTTYYYMLKAYDGNGNAGSSTSPVYSKATSSITTPALCFSNVTTSSITINWEPSNAVYYELYNCTADGDIENQYIYTIGGQSTYSFIHENLSPNTTYYYIIKAYDGRGNSAISPVYSCTTISTLTAPVLDFTDITTSSITINWERSTNALYYELYSCTSITGLEYNLVYTNGGGTSFSYNHNNLASNTTYYYIIKAYDKNGNVITSPIYSVTTK